MITNKELDELLASLEQEIELDGESQLLVDRPRLVTPTLIGPLALGGSRTLVLSPKVP